MVKPPDSLSSNPLVDPFMLRMNEILPFQKFIWVHGANAHLQIPAVCRDVGDLLVWFDDDEYTVSIGELFHTHFETYINDALPKEERISLAASDAVEFAADVLGDRIELRLTLIGGVPSRCSSFPIESKKYLSTMTEPDEIRKARKGNKETVRYLWSGRIG